MKELTPLREVRIPVKIDDRERDLIFNVNYMIAFEEATNGFYWDTMIRLFDFYKEILAPVADKSEEERNDFLKANVLDLLVKLSGRLKTKEQHALIWAALHEYPDGAEGEPRWPYTLKQLGRLIQPQQTLGLLSLILAGHNGNAPNRKELGEASGAENKKVVQLEKPAPKDETSGGQPSIKLDVADFG